jgi:hypothetical protein
MLVSADDCGVDAWRHAGSVQYLQHRIPNPGDGPAAELTVDGAPLAGSRFGAVSMTNVSKMPIPCLTSGHAPLLLSRKSSVESELR